MSDLFDWTPSAYPNSPGYREKTTSRDAARKMVPRAPTLRDDCLRALSEVWPAGLTPDETAALLGKTVLAIRPRFSELKASGEIVATTITRQNDSGLKARVYTARRPD
jgi:hypothetical protein